MSTPVLIALLVIALIVLEALRLLERRARRGRPIEEPGAQLSLTPDNSFTQVMTRFALGLAFVGGFVGLLLHFLDRDGLALATGLVPIVLALPVLWGLRRMHTGTIDIYATHLLVRTRANTQSYPWRDIAEVSIATWADASASDRLFVHATGVGFGDRFVQLRLRRSVRIGLGFFHTEFGTDVPGLPIGLKTIRLFAQDPDRAIEVLRPYIAGAARTITADVAST